MKTVLTKRSCFKKKLKSLQRLESRSSSSSSSFIPPKFDVFLSFRGLDTRKNFVSFLYKELEAKGIKTFKDDKALVPGRPIAPELVQAINGARIAVVVVSRTYASSCWCLEELVRILKLQRKDKLRVLPVFYEIDPCQVRRQTGEVSEQLKKHKKRYSSERVRSWRHALTRVTSLSGDCSKNCVDDATLVHGITKKISHMLSTVTPCHELTGFDEHMKKLYPLLDLSSNEGVQVSGIWGRGSKGRSALARHVYDTISHKFEAHCFLKDMKNISLHSRKSHLQEKLLSKMEGQGLCTKTSLMCFEAIKARLGNKKILLVANNVDKIDKLDALADEFNWFGPGSRIIITTQDKQLLTSCGVKSAYEVEFLRCCEVGKLWRSEAFKQKQEPVSFEDPPMNLPAGSHLFSSMKYLINYWRDGEQLRERINSIIDDIY